MLVSFLLVPLHDSRIAGIEDILSRKILCRLAGHCRHLVVPLVVLSCLLATTGLVERRRSNRRTGQEDAGRRNRKGRNDREEA